MFCPKCGVKNPDNGKFCRSCGTDLKPVSEALSGRPTSSGTFQCVNSKGKPITWESAFGKLFTGLAFVGVTIALANSQMGRGWWFWMLIPALTMIGAGIAQVVQIKSSERRVTGLGNFNRTIELDQPEVQSLPSARTEYVAPSKDSKYKTGDLVPSSVTDSTTRHLEMDSEGETMTLPKSNL